ncbi:MAG: lecithin retinol acyltransferase family protein [Anaeroplasmataceae bacterium]|jgi:NC domain.|nr:lecithin retinol acyltransferase family protein [Anaeroplasmataceae bacterium]
MWVIKEPNYGDQIKVNRGYYSHHGIYATKNSVYHFAPPGRTDHLDPSAARIIETTLEEFLKGGQLEVRVYTEEEKRKRRSPEEIIACAQSHLGEGGYDLVSYNCEHFSNLCTFGSKESHQVKEVLAMLFGGIRR